MPEDEEEFVESAGLGGSISAVGGLTGGGGGGKSSLSASGNQHLQEKGQW